MGIRETILHDFTPAWKGLTTNQRNKFIIWIILTCVHIFVPPF